MGGPCSPPPLYETLHLQVFNHRTPAVYTDCGPHSETQVTSAGIRGRGGGQRGSGHQQEEEEEEMTLIASSNHYGSVMSLC